MNRKLDKAPASLRERIEASERREKQSTSVLNSVEKKEKIIKAPDNFQLKTRVDPGTERTPVPVLSDVEKSEMNLIALKVAREEQRKRVLLINQKEKRLADMALRSMIEDENNFYG